MMHFAKYESPAGRLLLYSTEEALTGLRFGEEAEGICEEVPILSDTKRWLDAYFRGENPVMDIPLAPEGTDFQKQVWQCLQRIPQGAVRSYGEIAREMALAAGKKTMSAQAVGQAVGRNPIAILIPCHRVVGSRGALTGYAWGSDKKQWLLEHEQR